MDPADDLKLGIQWEGHYYLDRHCIFGFVHGSGMYYVIFTIWSYKIHYETRGLPNVTLLRWLHFDYGTQGCKGCSVYPLTQTKFVLPAKWWRVWVYDFIQNSMSIDTEKITQLVSKKIIMCKTWQSLTGRLLYVHQCLKPARLFINTILAIFRLNHHIAFIWPRVFMLSDGFQGFYILITQYLTNQVEQTTLFILMHVLWLSKYTLPILGDVESSDCFVVGEWRIVTFQDNHIL